MSRIGRREFVALSSAAALAGGASLPAAVPPPAAARPNRSASASGPAARPAWPQPRGWDLEAAPGDLFLGSSPMLGGVPPLLARSHKRPAARRPCR